MRIGSARCYELCARVLERYKGLFEGMRIPSTELRMLDIAPRRMKASGERIRVEEWGSPRIATVYSQ